MIKSFFGSSLPLAASNVLSDTKTKAGEVGTKIKGIFANARGDFKKMAAPADPFDVSAAKLSADRAQMGEEDPTKRVMDAIDDDIRAMTPDPFYATDVDRQVADLMAAASIQLDRVSASVINRSKRQTENDTEHMVRLVEKGSNGAIISEVEFRVMPEVVESRTVEYEPVAPPQFPSAFQKYKGTSSTQWTINATFTCRTTDEATKNLQILNILRGWTVPFFGTKTLEQFPDKLGAPPPVLTLSGWRAQMVGPVQVVITSLNWNFPQDVDYIPAREFKMMSGAPGNYTTTGRLIPFPTVIKVAIQLIESFSTEQMNGFSVGDFRTGQMTEAFKPMPRIDRVETPTTEVKTEAQSVPQGGAFRGLRSDYDPTRKVYAGLGASVGGGRGVINPPLVVPEKVVTEIKEATPPPPKQPLTDRFESGVSDKFDSGGGGDFGGGGASGDW